MKKPRILIVDDDSIILESLCEFLNLEGYETTGVSSFRQALEKLRQQTFSLVISDVNMPDGDGFLVSQRTVKFSSTVKSKSISIAVKANVAWNAQSNQPWLVASSNESILTLTAEPNPTDTIRKASVTVTSHGFESQTVDIIHRTSCGRYDPT